MSCVLIFLTNIRVLLCVCVCVCVCVVGEVAMATKQCQEWEKTLDAVQETRAKEREDYQQTLSYRVS